MKKDKIHYVASQLINTAEKVTIILIGTGGTGSNVLSCLAIINKSLIALGHPGIHVTAIDDDIVTENNVGRQLFYENDIGLPKAEVLVSRINRSFGLSWKCIIEKFDSNIFAAHENIRANIYISCVDSVSSRKAIYNVITKKESYRYYEREISKKYYWIDTGNSASSGQILIGTLKDIEQPKSKKYKCIDKLESPYEYFKNVIDSKFDGPSCSLAEALSKQDLFINRTIANYTGIVLWNMFREAKLQYKGIYINLNTLQINPIPL